MTNSQSTDERGKPLLKTLADRIPPARTIIVFFTVTVAAFALDLLTKWAVFKWLKDKSFVPVIEGYLRLVTVHNDGAAFGIFAGHLNWLIGVSFFALIVILGIFLFGGSKTKLMNIALTFFTAGICGNLYDRIFNDGLVRDFIDIGINNDLRWPAFNIADSLLCIGVTMMLLDIFITEMPCRKRAQRQKSAPS